MRREVIIGTGAALLVFALAMGIDPMPVIILAGLFLAMRYLTDNRRGNAFQVVGGGSQGNPVTSVTFDDIGGQEVAKRELLEALDFARDAARVAKLGIRPLKGILLTGPPGTGKTMLAKASATYTQSAFVAASGSEFVEMYAGVGAQRVRSLFAQARQLAEKGGKESAIIFIDEIDVLGGKRGSHSSHLEYDQTLNQLLVEMDGLKAADKVRVLVVAATNRADLLDQALLRPGRFDRQVQVELPDREGRRNILAIHTANKPIGSDVDLDELARETYGFSGAHLESVANEAAILAFRDANEQISMSHFKEAIDKVIMGERLDHRPSGEELARVAVHEVGHALVSEIVSPNSVSTITVTSRGRALGYMRHAPEDEHYLYTAGQLRDQIAVALGGAMAEELAYGSRSTGSAGDFEQVTNLSKQLIYSGLSRLGVVSPNDVPGEKLQSEISDIVRAEEERVREMLSGRLDFMRHVQQFLLEQECIAGNRFRELLAA